MKSMRIFLTIGLAASCLGLIAQNKPYNPYKSIGKEAKVLTLSNGKYEEFFDTDTIEIIGSAVLNTKTMKVIGFVEQDTLYSEATLEPEIVSRWLSPDPLARKYPCLSPYSFVNNNPIYNIEVDGRYFTGNTATVKATYAIVSQLAAKGNERAIAFKAALEKMDASDVEFNIQNTTKMGWQVGSGKGGNTTFDVKNNRVVIDVFRFTGGTEHAVSEEGRTGHELEHGSQFLEGEIDFLNSSPGNFYDQTDEEKAFQIQNMITNTQLRPDERAKTDENALESAKNYDLPTQLRKQFLLPKRKDIVK
jgi:hypothetical protein